MKLSRLVNMVRIHNGNNYHITNNNSSDETIQFQTDLYLILLHKDLH